MYKVSEDYLVGYRRGYQHATLRMPQEAWEDHEIYSGDYDAGYDAGYEDGWFLENPEYPEYGYRYGVKI